MRKHAAPAATLLLALVTFAPAMPLPEAWRFWRYWRAVETEATAKAHLIGVVLPQEVYGRSANLLADLRVIDDRGTEAAFVLAARYGSTHTETRTARHLERSFLPGKFTQVILDAGQQSPFHNALRVETASTDFIAWAEVAVSDDGRDWRIVCDRAPLYRFRKQNLEGSQTLRYSETNARYVRLRILDSSERFALSRVEVQYDVGSAAERVPVSASLVPAHSKNAQESVWTSDLGAPLPVDEVRFESEQPEFSRAVVISESDDGQAWNQAGEGEIYRFRRGDALREWRRIGFPEVWSRRWRVEVMNSNDAPLAGARVTLFMTPRRVVFRQEPGRSYFLLYGQSEARRPQYDLGRTAAATELQDAAPATLGAEEVNTNYTDPRPWTEQHSAVLWVAAIVAAALLGISALRSLRHSS